MLLHRGGPASDLSLRHILPRLAAVRDAQVRDGKSALAELSNFIEYQDGERSMHRDKLTREFESILQKFQDVSPA